ncbi:MAG: efflux transporter outer membrane subunit [Polyangiaceae bacterium]|nr:efflux transporter outer membrane subunit [Polyangiaceae bacterium]
MTKTFAVALWLAWAVPGCMVHDANTNPESPVKPPEQYASPDNAGPRPTAAREPGAGAWWNDFGDPELARLVDRALEGSLEFRQTWARLEQAEALARQSGARLHPNVNAELSAGRSRRVVALGSGPSMPVTSNNFSASVPVSYEVDLWGNLRSAARAAAFDAFASRDEVEAAAMTLAANVAESWFDILKQRARKKLLREQLLTNEAFLELVMLRFGQGQASGTEELQQRQEVQAARAQLARVEAQEAVTTQRLSVLVGRLPSSLVTASADQLPVLPTLPAQGVPSDLLRRRPDVRAAQRRVVAADYRIGEAIAKRYPSLTLSASVGYSSPSLSELLDSFVWSVMGSISQSLWDGGRRSAEVDRTRAVLEERLLGYGHTLLTAMLEVESSLVQEQQQLENIRELEQQVQTSAQALDIARMRYQQGLTDFLPVLTSLRSMHLAQQSLVDSKRQLLSHRIQLCRALGGTWTNQLEKPAKEGEGS